MSADLKLSESVLEELLMEKLASSPSDTCVISYQISSRLKQLASQPPAPFGNSIPGKILITALSSSRA